MVGKKASSKGGLVEEAVFVCAKKMNKMRVLMWHIHVL